MNIQVNEKLEKSVERLLSRDDVRLTREQVNNFLNTGQWSGESFVDYLEQNAKRNPNKTAICDEDGRKTTFNEYHQKTDRIALALLGLGIKPGDRIAIQLPNCSEFCLSLMGAAKASILPVLCHMPYSENDLNYVIGLSEAKAIIIPDTFKNKNYIEMIKNVQQNHPYLEHIIVLSEKEYEGTVSFYNIIQKENDESKFSLDEVRPFGTDPFFVIFTSGTTGRPKAILHLHANSAFWIKQLNKVIQLTEDDNWLIPTPLAHLGALGLGFLSSLYLGNSFTLLSAWDVNNAVNLIEKEKPSFMFGIAPMLIDIARFDGLEERNISSIKNIVYASAPCPYEILNILSERIGCEIIALYGLSEAGLTHCTRPGDNHSITSTSFGKAIEGVEDKIIDGSKKELQLPCEGELVERGANFIPGYFRQPENNITMFDEEGWFYTADIVQMKEDGYGTFVSRRDDLINRGGYKIDPIEIEETLYTHPLISKAMVVGMPDERLGERIAAFIILKDPKKTLTLEDICRFLSKKGIGKNKCPEALKIVDSFPMTASGKFQRFALREQAKELSL